MNLYQISENIRALADIGEPDSPVHWQAVKDTLDGLEGEFSDKAEQIGKLVSMLTRQADACELESVRLKDRSRNLRIRADSVKGYLYNMMKRANMQRVDTDLFNINIRKMPARVEVDEDLLPAEWTVSRMTYRPDKRAIKDALEQGVEIKGAILVQDAERLYIK